MATSSLGAAGLNTRNRKLPKPDADGCLRRVVGILPDGKKARFTVGNRTTSPAEAERRVDTIRRLFEGQCRHRSSTRWSMFGLLVAKRIASGQAITTPFLVSITTDETTAAQSARELLSYGVPVQVDESHAHAEERWKAYFDEKLAEVVRNFTSEQRAIRGPIVDVYAAPQNVATLIEEGTFHEAIRAFSKSIREEKPRNQYGKLTPNAQAVLRRMKALIEQHEDFPLRTFDLDRVRKIVAHWQARPITRKGTPSSDDWIKDVLKTFRSFAKWLDLSPQFSWVLPRGFDEVTNHARPSKQAKQTGPFRQPRKKVWSVEELTKLVEVCPPYWKTVVMLAVNVSGGQGELGRLKRQENFAFDTLHPHAAKLGFETIAEDSWITGERPKSGVYGEHLIWPEVAEALQRNWVVNEHDLFLVNEEGVPWYRTWTDSPSSNFDRFFKERFVEKAGIPVLPFGSLRDLLANMLREKYGKEISTLQLQHGEDSDDDLLASYTNEPFARLFMAIRELRSTFAPALKLLD